MASVATAMLIDGKVEIPERTLRSLHLQDGIQFDVVETDDGILLRPPDDVVKRERWEQFSFDEVMAANRRRLGLSEDDNSWRTLEGILSDDLLDTLEEKHRLRDEELEHDKRKLEG